LRGFLFERHAREQVGNAAIYGELFVPVRKQFIGEMAMTIARERGLARYAAVAGPASFLPLIGC